MVNVPSSEATQTSNSLSILPLPVGEIHLWRACTDAPPNRIAWLAECLTEDEKRRAARFHFEHDRNVFTMARGLLRHILAGIYLQEDPAFLVFGTGVAGKPYLRHPVRKPALQFNIAHSDTAILLAFARHEVGVDVERIRPDFNWQELSGQVFTDEEQQQLRQLPSDRRLHGFFSGWTRKEAFIKAKGGGLSIPLRTFSVSLDSIHARLLNIPAEPGESEHWFLADIDYHGKFSAAVAARSPSCTCRCFEVLDAARTTGLSYREM